MRGCCTVTRSRDVSIQYNACHLAPSWKEAPLLLLLTFLSCQVNLRDPIDPPLVNNPGSITPQLEARLRELVANPRDESLKDKEMAN